MLCTCWECQEFCWEQWCTAPHGALAWSLLVCLRRRSYRVCVCACVWRGFGRIPLAEMWIFVKSNVWNPGQSRKLVVRLRATRPKASLTARLFRRFKKKNQSSPLWPCCLRTYSSFSSKASSKTMCSEVQTKMLTHPDILWKTDNPVDWSSYLSLQEPTKSSASEELRLNQAPSKLLLYFSLKHFLLPHLICNWPQLATWQSSLCSQACLTVATATLSNTRVQRWCPVLLQGTIKCCTKWSLKMWRETYPDV